MENNQSGQDDIAVLIYKHIKGILNEDEQNILYEWIAKSADNKDFFDEITDSTTLVQELADYNRALNETDKEEVWQRLVNRNVLFHKTKRF